LAGGFLMASITQPHLNKLRKDKFVVTLSLPNIMKQLQSRSTREDKFINLDSLQFSVYNINIPSVTVPEHQLHYGQQNYNVTSYDRPAYAPVVINFEVDNEFKNYWVLWKWLQLLNDPTNAAYGGKGIFPGGMPVLEPKIVPNYQTTIVANAMDEYNNEKARFVFTNSFITTLGELDYNYRDSGQLQCSFTFVFNRLDIELLDDGTDTQKFA